MIQAFRIIRSIYNAFINFVFNQFQIVTYSGSPVYFGWICIVCIVFAIILRNIVSVPSKIHISHRIGKREDD